MSFTDAIKTCFRKYFTFSGRASRPEYWWFFLFQVLGGLVLGFVEGFVNAVSGEGSGGPAILTSVFNLAVFVPGLAVGWRRMHDSGRSGLYLFYPLIVMVGIGTFAAFFGATPDSAGLGSLGGIASLILVAGIIVFLISPLLVIWWLTRPTEPVENKYGPPPWETAA